MHIYNRKYVVINKIYFIYILHMYNIYVQARKSKEASTISQVFRTAILVQQSKTLPNYKTMKVNLDDRNCASYKSHFLTRVIYATLRIKVQIVPFDDAKCVDYRLACIITTIFRSHCDMLVHVQRGLREVVTLIMDATE